MKKILALGVAWIFTNIAFSQQVSSMRYPEPVFCTADYTPVCAQQTLYCIKAPCPQPEPKTYSNACQAWIDNAKILYKWTCEKPASNTTIDNPYLQKRVTALETNLINYAYLNNLNDSDIVLILEQGIAKIENTLMTSRMLPWRYAQYLFQKKVFQYTKAIFEKNY